LQSEDLRECLELLNDSGEYIKQLVETLLELRAIRDGRMSLSRSPTDVGAVVRQAVTHSMVYAQSKAIALRMQFDSELPPVQADDLRLMQVLDNLIGNAIKFSPLGKQVLVRTRYENQTILCEVVDEGPGIVESDRAKLFVEYAKLRNKPTGNETSTGLGLSICREFDSAARGYHWHAGQRQRRIDILVPTFAARIEAIAPLGDRLTATLARRRK